MVFHDPSQHLVLKGLSLWGLVVTGVNTNGTVGSNVGVMGWGESIIQEEERIIDR